jgi:hypothetical protein
MVCHRSRPRCYPNYSARLRPSLGDSFPDDESWLTGSRFARSSISKNRTTSARRNDPPRKRILRRRITGSCALIPKSKIWKCPKRQPATESTKIGLRRDWLRCAGTRFRCREQKNKIQLPKPAMTGVVNGLSATPFNPRNSTRLRNRWAITQSNKTERQRTLNPAASCQFCSAGRQSKNCLSAGPTKSREQTKRTAYRSTAQKISCRFDTQGGVFLNRQSNPKDSKTDPKQRDRF